MEALTHPARVAGRWWTGYWSEIFQLEAHAQRTDPTISRLRLATIAENPRLRRYVDARFRQSPYDLWGYIAPADGPWPERRLVALMPQAPWDNDPLMLCIDGPTDSLHRNSPIELCVYYVRDPDERRWKPSDGLVRLFDLGRRHLMCEHLWRLGGRRPQDWPVVDARHGFGPAAAPAPELLLPAELPLGRRGGGVLAA